MGADDFRGRIAFLNALATTLRGYGFPDGSPAVDTETGRTWTFYENEVNNSMEVFKLTIISGSRIDFTYNLHGIQRSGSVEDTKDIKGVLP